MNITNLLVNAQDFILPGILLVLLVISAGMAFMRKSKYTQSAMEMKNNLKIGDKVKTYAGMYGEIVAIKEAVDGSKYVVLKSGEGEYISYFSIDIEAIYGVDYKDEIDDMTENATEVTPTNIEETTEELAPAENIAKATAPVEDTKINGEAVEEVKEKKTRKSKTAKKEN